mgnify:CR=1 FL=1
MAWNEPGGNSNNQDPWGGGKKNDDQRDQRGGRQGPPEVDEAFRNLINGIFGKRSGGGSSGGGSRAGKGAGLTPVWIGLGVLFAVWLFNSVYVVDEQEQAVILRLGKYHETVGPGLNIYFPPIDQKFQANVTRERSYSKQGQMLTEDENIIEVPLTVQYRIGNLKDFVLAVDDPEQSLQQATDSAVRHVVGSTSMDQVLTEGREVMAGDVKSRLQSFMDLYGTGIVVTQVNLQSAAAPREVQEAFDDVIRAREDEQREKNQAESYANSVIPEARGQAQRMLEEASGYRDSVVARAKGESDRFSKLVHEYNLAPEVTRQRLYLETMQDVLSNTSKVLVTGDKGQNNLLYLPLDKMVNSGASAVRQGGSESANAVAPSYNATPATAPRQADSSRDLRSRESR